MKTTSVRFVNITSIKYKKNMLSLINSLNIFLLVTLKLSRNGLKLFPFYVKGENSYNCNETKYAKVTKTKVINTCNTQRCSELTPTWSVSIHKKLVSQKNVGWLEQHKGNQYFNTH